MTKLPKVPIEQRSFKANDAEAQASRDHRDEVTNLQSGQPGDADANLDQQGRFGNLRQNMTTQHKSGDR